MHDLHQFPRRYESGERFSRRRQKSKPEKQIEYRRMHHFEGSTTLTTQLRALAIAFGLCLAAAGPASAAITSTQNTTPLDMYPATVPGVQFAFISKAIMGDGVDFDDLFTFDISGAGSSGSGSATALSTAITGLSIIHAQVPITLRLLAWDGDGYDTVLADSGLSFAPQVQHALDVGVGGAPGFGFYALEVIGSTPLGAAITQYAGQLQVAAVPEPSAWLTLLGGLGAIGWIARRRMVPTGI
jgi:PEP-CTERM motif